MHEILLIRGGKILVFCSLKNWILLTYVHNLRVYVHRWPLQSVWYFIMSSVNTLKLLFVLPTLRKQCFYLPTNSYELIKSDLMQRFGFAGAPAVFICITNLFPCLWMKCAFRRTFCADNEKSFGSVDNRTRSVVGAMRQSARQTNHLLLFYVSNFCQKPITVFFHEKTSLLLARATRWVNKKSPKM
jgi:hypothetical protein